MGGVVGWEVGFSWRRCGYEEWGGFMGRLLGVRVVSVERR